MAQRWDCEVPCPAFYSVLVMAAVLPFFQSPGTSPECRDFSNIMEGGLETTSATSLRTLGCISSGPMDWCMFRFLRWSRTWSSLTVGGLCSPCPCLAVHPVERCGKRDRQGRLRQKSCWVPQPSPCLVLPVCQSCSSGRVQFLWPPFSGSHTCRSPSYYF